MHGLHAARRFRFHWIPIAVCAMVLLPATADEDSSGEPPADPVTSPLAVVIDADRITQFDCRIRIKGSLSTPSGNEFRQWKLDSAAELKFDQRQLPSELSGPQAVRQYSSAVARTTVGEDYTTQSTLPRSGSVMQVRGADDRLHVAPLARPLTRQQFDLLQMPCDPLFCASLLPTREVKVGEKWNTDAWVMPRLSGLEAVTEQSLSCTLQSLDEAVATIAFTGTASGAALGSASSVELKGTLKLNQDTRLLTELRAQMKEKRSAGPVSPGIDATVDIGWSQTAIENSKLPQELDESVFGRSLSLRTPWRLMVEHSPEWHIFNQTERVIMLRQMRDGALISQCNISIGNAMPPGQHTPDPDFRSDVEADLQSQGGRIITEKTLRDDGKWRIRHVQSSAMAGEAEIIRDHYLCTAASGEQFSLMFSHSTTDSEAFGDESQQILSTLALARRRPALPFRN